MKGEVCEINQSRGMVAVQTENGDFSVFELLGGDSIEIRDEVSWQDDTSLGSTRLRNITQGSSYEVYFQNHSVSGNQLRGQLLYGD
jgi:hypothetical protein